MVRSDTTSHGTKTNRRKMLKGIAGASSAGLVGFTGCVTRSGNSGSNGSGNNSSSGSSGGKDKYSLKLATGADKINALYKGLERLSKTVEKKSDGRLQIDVICCNKAGGPPEIAQSIQSGTLDMGLGAVNNLANVTKAWLFNQLPYLWKDHQTMYDFWNSADVVKKVNQKAHNDLSNVLMKAYWGSGGGSFRHMHTSSSASFKIPADNSGQKIRVTESPLDKATVNGWGFSPSTVSWSETVQAMKQGVVDGIHIQYFWLLGSGMYKQIEYTVETGDMDSPTVLQMNEKSYNNLPKDLQKILDSAIEELTPKVIKWDIKQGEKAKKKMKENGVKIYKPTKSEMNKWQQVTKPVYDQWIGKKGVPKDTVKKAIEFQDNYSPPGVEL